jgi:hypothetical protein
VPGGASAGGVAADRTVVPGGLPPNLNLIERLWKFEKKECLGCRVLPTDEVFTQAIDDYLAKLNTRHKYQMKTLLNLEFQLFDEDVPFLAAQSISYPFG